MFKVILIIIVNFLNFKRLPIAKVNCKVVYRRDYLPWLIDWVVCIQSKQIILIQWFAKDLVKKLVLYIGNLKIKVDKNLSINL